MTMPFSVNGARAVIPGVYDSFKVAGSLPAPVPAGRNILLLGESEKGIPGQELDLRLNYFTDFQSVKDFYGDGAISDAARMVFTTQPSPVFGGAVQRLYVWKSNQTTRATKVIASPVNYGSVAAAEFGEAGNFIKSQILEVAQALATKTVAILPRPGSYSVEAVVNGVATSVTVGALDISTGVGTASQFATLLAGVTGLSTSGGTARSTIVNPNTVDVSFSATGDQLTITKTAGAGNFGTATLAGDIVIIPEGSALAGASDQNAGAYLVVSWSATQMVLKQLKHYQASAEANWEAFDLTSAAAVDETDFAAYSPLTITVTAGPVTGAGGSLELFAGAAGTGTFYRDADVADILTAPAAAVGKIAATVPTSGQLQITLTGAAWSRVPAKGDPVRIGRGSLVAGAGNANTGLYVATAATGGTLTLRKLAGTTVAVAQINLDGATSPVQAGLGFVSVPEAGLKLTSSQERQVYVEASRITDGVSFPTTRTGGAIALELSYNLAGVTAATATIDQNRILTITPTGAGATLTVLLNKYKTLGMLTDYLNTQAGISARVPDSRNRSLPTNVLDMVTAAPILGAQDSVAAYNGRLKMDYYAWKKLFADNFGLLAFAEGTLVLKAGLPDAEADAAFLTGAVIGASSDADVQKGLDQALKIDARMVVPLMSRDARYDVEDALTDANSSYSIDSIHAAVRNHVATASSTLWKRERFGILSFHGAFDDTVQKTSDISYERCQMMFQDTRATDSNGSLQWFCPWMLAVAVSAGRAQAPLGTSMLRKSFAVNAVRHTGNTSLFTDTLAQDFDPEDQGLLTEAIEAGLVCLKAAQGVGVQMVSPDLTTRSRENDPEAWVYERVNVLFTCDEVRQTLRSTLENFIGNRQNETPMSVVKTAGNDTIGTFIGGALLSGQITNIKRVGTGYRAEVKITPVEALEFIVLDVLAERAPQGDA